MVSTTNLPPDPMGEFELPPTAGIVAQRWKEASWSATPEQIDKETVKKRKQRIQYEIISSMSVKLVLKDTFTMFKTTDPQFLLISPTETSTIIKTADDFDKIPAQDFLRLFPAEIKNSKTWMSLYAVTHMNISCLKQFSFGFYEYAARKVWIQVNYFVSSDMRNIGFIIRKDPRKVNQDLLADQLYEILSDHPLLADNSGRWNEAKEALPFCGLISRFNCASTIKFGMKPRLEKSKRRL
jgi:hypothetical protein